MKAEELMIGDWVYLSTPERMLPCKVTAIDENSIWQEYYKEICDPKDYKPISITAEILEKNGFLGEAYYILSIDKFSWLEYYCFERRLRKKWRGVDEWQNHAKVTEITFQCHCSYVHELQHALRLCGIDKEIIL